MLSRSGLEEMEVQVAVVATLILALDKPCNLTPQMVVLATMEVSDRYFPTPIRAVVGVVLEAPETLLLQLPQEETVVTGWISALSSEQDLEKMVFLLEVGVVAPTPTQTRLVGLVGAGTEVLGIVASIHQYKMELQILVVVVAVLVKAAFKGEVTAAPASFSYDTKSNPLPNPQTTGS